MNYWPSDVTNAALIAQANRIAEAASRPAQGVNLFAEQVPLAVNEEKLLKGKEPVVLAVVPADSYTRTLTTGALILMLSATLAYSQSYVVFAYYSLVSSSFWTVSFMWEFLTAVAFAVMSVLCRMFMLPFIRRVSTRIVNVYAKEEMSKRQRDDAIVSGTWGVLSNYSVEGAWGAMARASVLASVKVVKYVSYLPMVVIISIFFVCIAQRMPLYMEGGSPVESLFDSAVKTVWGANPDSLNSNSYYQTVTNAYNHYFRPNNYATSAEQAVPPPVASYYSSWPRK